MGLNSGCFGNEGGTCLSQGRWGRNSPQCQQGLICESLAEPLLHQSCLVSYLNCYNGKAEGFMGCLVYCSHPAEHKTGLGNRSWETRQNKLWRRVKQQAEKQGSFTGLCTFLPEAGCDEALLSVQSVAHTLSLLEFG